MKDSKRFVASDWLVKDIGKAKDALVGMSVYNVIDPDEASNLAEQEAQEEFETLLASIIILPEPKEIDLNFKRINLDYGTGNGGHMFALDKEHLMRVASAIIQVAQALPDTSHGRDEIERELEELRLEEAELLDATARLVDIALARKRLEEKLQNK